MFDFTKDTSKWCAEQLGLPSEIEYSLVYGSVIAPVIYDSEEVFDNLPLDSLVGKDYFINAVDQGTTSVKVPEGFILIGLEEKESKKRHLGFVDFSKREL